MRDAIGNTEYVCAFGYTVVNHNGTLEDEILIEYKAMYEDKARLKKAVLDSGGELHNRTN